MEDAVNTWTTMGQDSLAAAKRLLDDGFYRSSISRAYYSAYATVTGLLVNQGVNVQSREHDNPAHSQLHKLAYDNLSARKFDQETRKKIKMYIRQLRLAREGADYEPLSGVDKAVARNSVRVAAALRRECEVDQ